MKQPVQLKPAVRYVSRPPQARVAPPRVVVVESRESPRTRSARDMQTISWLTVGMLVLGGFIPQWQPLLLIALILLAPLHVVVCILAMVRGAVLRGVFYLAGVPLLAVFGIFGAWSMIHVR